MTGALLVAGLGAIALGGVLVAARATLRAGLVLQAAGAAGVAVAGFWVLAAGDALGAAFTSAFDPRFGVDGLSGFFLGTLGVGRRPHARLLDALPGADAGRAGSSACSLRRSCSRSPPSCALATRSRSSPAGS